MVQLESMTGPSRPALALAAAVALCLPSMVAAETSSTTVTSLDLVTVYPTTTRVTILTTIGSGLTTVDSGTLTSTIWVQPTTTRKPALFMNAGVGLFDAPSTLVTQHRVKTNAVAGAAPAPTKKAAAPAQQQRNSTVAKVAAVTKTPASPAEAAQVQEVHEVHEAPEVQDVEEFAEIQEVQEVQEAEDVAEVQEIDEVQEDEDAGPGMVPFM
ncbi:hypothetical protein MAPG_07906 [Magnaporthiopsis poae ATCC 64411]|uniref:Uncharacterized protein n=1 Tax=Magnaporthiopsis poae (strain ATCC 64411 / 73-15) TaxID=644358 RepID=A0A0C4E5X8_MAGP6|nr:hypothetical protein MAPG_07906 [Magnaporthiopsis poae ATCC 64411]